jgi:hypothetical protein
MKKSEDSYPEQNTLRFVAVAYHAVMLGVFVIGLYGLLSLFSLASRGATKGPSHPGISSVRLLPASAFQQSPCDSSKPNSEFQRCGLREICRLTSPPALKALRSGC